MLDTILLDEPLARREAPPAYSFEPCSGEQRLELTPRHGHTPLTGSIIKRFAMLSLVLPEQEDGAQIPSYGRNGVIDGVFCFDDPSRIIKVMIKLHGKAETTTTESGTNTKCLLNDQYTLWQKNNMDEPSCPNQLNFACALPSTYSEGNGAKPLPPSFHFAIPGFSIKIHYCILVQITLKRRSKLDFSSSVKEYPVLFKYWPRSRPNRPFEATPCFLFSVKTLPEEWHQTISSLKTRSNEVARETLHCHFFVPSIRIFGLSDTIPFHVQLNGPISSLRDFFPPDVLQRVTSADSSLSAPSVRPKSSGRRSEGKQHSVRAQLLQQIVVMVDSCKVVKNSTVGEGVVHPLPPSLYRDRCLGTMEETLDWEGFVKCNDDVKVGSFSTGLIQVQHFLSLSLTPLDVRRSPFQVLNIHVPVKLVTDSYEDYG